MLSTGEVGIKGASILNLAGDQGASQLAGFQFSGSGFEKIFVYSRNSTIGNLSKDNGWAIGTGTVTQNGFLTVKGSGGNIASFRNSSNVEKISFSNGGQITAAEGYLVNTSNGSFFADSGGAFGNVGYSYFDSNVLGEMQLLPWSGSNIRLQFGGTTTDFPAIVATNTPATLAAKDATGTNLIPFSAEDFTSANLSAGTLNTARPMQFGDKGTVTTGNDLGLDAQIAVEHNGNVYYIPCSTVLLT
jgi:hypothetical protein